MREHRVGPRNSHAHPPHCFIIAIKASRFEEMSNLGRALVNTRVSGGDSRQRFQETRQRFEIFRLLSSLPQWTTSDMADVAHGPSIGTEHSVRKD
jgi:hypothetical protein